MSAPLSAKVSVRAAAEASAVIPVKANTMNAAPTAKANARTAETAAGIPAKANTMGAAKAEVAVNLVANVSARATEEATAVILTQACTMGAAEAEVAANLVAKASVRAAEKPRPVRWVQLRQRWLPNRSPRPAREPLPRLLQSSLPRPAR